MKRWLNKGGWWFIVDAVLFLSKPNGIKFIFENQSSFMLLYLFQHNSYYKFNILHILKFFYLICCVVVYKFEQRISLYINASTKSTSKICYNKQYVWSLLLFTPESLFDQNISAILTTTSFLNAAYQQLNDIDEPECQNWKRCRVSRPSQSVH